MARAPVPTARPGGGAARRYNRLAPVYDLIDAPMDALGGRERRRRLLADAVGRVLEVGVGTGRNLDLYPPDVDLTAIDISARMLSRARRRADRLGVRVVALALADIESLPFPDGSFDTVTATCVFCSVDQPLRGLEEVRRIVRPGGLVLLLEHVRPSTPALGAVFDALNPLVRRIGPEINRRTVERVAQAGLVLVDVEATGVWRAIRATRELPAGHGARERRKGSSRTARRRQVPGSGTR